MSESAARPQSPRVARRRAQARERILDAAEEIFAVSGVKNGRIEDLSAAADVSVGSIYTHFGDKQGIVLGLAERSIREFGEALNRALSERTAGPLERLMSVADLYARFCLEHRSSFQFVVANGLEASTDNEAHLAAVVDAERRLLGRFQDAVQEAIEAGEIDSGYEAGATARFLWGAWNGVFALMLRTDGLALGEAEVAAALDVGRRLVHAGLAARAWNEESGHGRPRTRDVL